MMHVRQEGEKLHNGFNFYPLSDDSSFGFVFRYGPKIPETDLGSKAFWFRYSKNTKQWIIKRQTVDHIVKKFLDSEESQNEKN